MDVSLGDHRNVLALARKSNCIQTMPAVEVAPQLQKAREVLLGTAGGVP
jgi:hypothetical protein